MRVLDRYDVIVNTLSGDATNPASALARGEGTVHTETR
jgi:hypothetical protein